MGPVARGEFTELDHPVEVTFPTGVNVRGFTVGNNTDASGNTREFIDDPGTLATLAIPEI